MTTNTHTPTSRSVHAARLGRASRLGTGAWMLAGPLLLAMQLIVQLAWSVPFSWSRNNISDLGNTRCQTWGDDHRYVCSPHHLMMNVSFVVTGAAVLAGVVLLWRAPALGTRRGARALVAIAGAGLAVAGFYPADINENVHVVFGAVPLLFGGNAALVRLAVDRSAAGAVRTIAATCGAAGLMAALLFLSHTDLGVGPGGMERLAVWPLFVFLFGAGLYLFLDRRRPRRA